MTWHRREVLWALAATAAAPLTTSCGGARGTRRGRRAELGLEDAVAELQRRLALRHPGVSALVIRRQETEMLRTGDEIDLQRGGSQLLVLSGRTAAGQLRQVTTTELGEDGLERAGLTLLEMLGPGGRRSPDNQRRERRWKQREALEPIAAGRLRSAGESLYDAVSKLPSSRLIRRSARVRALHRQLLFVSEDRLLEATTTHTLASASVIAWTGSVASPAAVAVGGGGLAELNIPSSELEAMRQWALALLTARDVPRATTSVILSPPVAAALIGACLAPCLDGWRWLSGECPLSTPGAGPVASELVEISDAPRPDGFSALPFDDTGAVTEAAALLRRGRVEAALGAAGDARARRHLLPEGHRWRGLPTRMRMHPGRSTLAQLIGGIDDGVLIEGPMSAQVDPGTLGFRLRASRGRGIEKGALSGRLYGSLEIRGHLGDVLRAIDGVGAREHALPFGLSADDLRPRLVSAPAVATRAQIGPA